MNSEESPSRIGPVVTVQGGAPVFENPQANNATPRADPVGHRGVDSDTVSEDPINDDDRSKFDWETRYPAKALEMIRTDAIVVSIALAISAIGILLTWRGDLLLFASWNCYECNVGSFNQYSYVCFAGLLGGSLYSIKYLYKVVARGYWNADRRLWRLFSVPLAAGLAVATCAFFDAGVFGFAMGEKTTGASYFSLGFITGYFADRAIGKMQEIAETVFGNPHSQHHHPKNK